MKVVGDRVIQQQSRRAANCRKRWNNWKEKRDPGEPRDGK